MLSTTEVDREEDSVANQSYKKFRLPVHPLADIPIPERYEIYNENYPTQEELEFIELCKAGAVDKIAKILRNKEKRHLVDAIGQRPLDEALERGNIELAKLLIVNGADLDFSIRDNQILRDVVSNGHMDTLKFLVEDCEVDLDHATEPFEGSLGDYRWSLNLEAIRANQVEMLDYMADHGLDIGLSLGLAVYENRLDILLHLLSSRKFKAKDYLEGFNCALEMERQDFARAIKEKSDFHQEVMETMMTLVNEPSSSSCMESRSRMPISEALAGGHIELARLLLAHEADLNLSLRRHQILCEVVANGRMDVLRFLVEECKVDLANVTTPIEGITGDYRRLIAIRAIENNHMELLEYMADHGLPIGSSLYSLVQHGKLEDLTRFLSKWKFEKKDYLDAFNIACEQGLVDYARAILDKAFFYKEDISAAYAHAKNRNQTEIVELIKSRKFPRDPKQSAGSCAIQ